jgi:uracil-DNA glycosylase
MFKYLENSFLSMTKSYQELFLNNCLDELHIIDNKLIEISNNEIIYPDSPNTFKAFSKFELAATRVVILGQDPYHGAGEANGLAFSVNSDIKIPPSLRNIYKELELEFGNAQIDSGDRLISWANQGVLLLNATLTVIKDKPNSLANIGWQAVTDKIISEISKKASNVVFMLWGSFAQKKASLIDGARHCILSTTHPSPLSAYRGFLGCNHFKLANEYLVKNNKNPIVWI